MRYNTVNGVDVASTRNLTYSGLTQALTKIVSNASGFTLGNLQALRKSCYLCRAIYTAVEMKTGVFYCLNGSSETPVFIQS